jgi:ribosomal protein S18 acetylase RimI-like enzyme
MPSVRLATPDDAAIVAALLVEFRNHLGYDWPDDASFLAGVTRLLEDPSTDYVIGHPSDDAPAAGVVALRFRYGIWRAGDDCLVEDVYVSDTARGSGLGKAMIEFAIQHARSRGARRMELDTNETNTAAIGLYEGVGFKNSTAAYEGRDLYFRLHLDAGKDA